MYERSVVEAVLRLIRQGPPLLQILVGAGWARMPSARTW
jgi:hypothetical protein